MTLLLLTIFGSIASISSVAAFLYTRAREIPLYQIGRPYERRNKKVSSVRFWRPVLFRSFLPIIDEMLELWPNDRWGDGATRGTNDLLSMQRLVAPEKVALWLSDSLLDAGAAITYVSQGRANLLSFISLPNGDAPGYLRVDGLSGPMSLKALTSGPRYRDIRVLESDNPDIQNLAAVARVIAQQPASYYKLTRLKKERFPSDEEKDVGATDLLVIAIAPSVNGSKANQLASMVITLRMTWISRLLHRHGPGRILLERRVKILRSRLVAADDFFDYVRRQSTIDVRSSTVPTVVQSKSDAEPEADAKAGGGPED